MASWFSGLIGGPVPCGAVPLAAAEEANLRGALFQRRADPSGSADAIVVETRVAHGAPLSGAGRARRGLSSPAGVDCCADESDIHHLGH